MKKTAYFLLFLTIFLTSVTTVGATKISNPTDQIDPAEIITVETVEPGLLPSSPFYFFETITESIQTLFTFGNNAKARRYFSLAEERLAEAKALAENGDVKQAAKMIKNSAKYFEKAWEKINILVEAGKESADTLGKIADIISTHQQTLSSLTQNNQEQSREMLRALVNNDKEKLRELLDQNVSQEEKVELIKEFRQREKVTVQKIKNLNLEEGSDSPIAVLAPQGSGGKPGMNEDGSTQVARPQGASSGCNTKLYQCKIDCGQNIINNCNEHAADRMYELMMCQGDCYKYNIFYGCGMEAECDEPCWQDYENACGPEVYQVCINDCEETFN